MQNMSRFFFKKQVTREKGPAGVELRHMGIPGRENLVEALDDFEVEDDRASDHLDPNDVYIEVGNTNKTTEIYQANSNSNKPLLNNIHEDYFLDIEKRERLAKEKAKRSVEDWMHSILHGADHPSIPSKPEILLKPVPEPAKTAITRPTKPKVQILDDVSRAKAMRYAVLAANPDKPASNDNGNHPVDKPNVKAAKDAMASAIDFLSLGKNTGVPSKPEKN
ncbi:hypothetical protein IL306_007794 [Fusarium sp. DS 682]|nr:hypothetical protein IL306_007794 [Fusarium sp. DS 682]